jgi:hypothetical protein
MKILQRNLDRGRFVLWEMKRNVSVACVCSAPNIFISGKIIKEMPGSVASGTRCIICDVYCVVCYNFKKFNHRLFGHLVLPNPVLRIREMRIVV